MKKYIAVPTFVILICVIVVGCAENTVGESSKLQALQAKINDLQEQIDKHDAERAATAKHLGIFDELDLVAFNNRDMERIKQIHADDVKVYNPG